MASIDLNVKSEPKTIRRIEVLTGPERRRKWSVDDKERILAESYSGTDSVSRVARRHGLQPQQLFNWRREVRRLAPPPAFAAVALAPAAKAEPRGSGVGKTKLASEIVVEISADGVAVRVHRGADSSMVAAIVRALKATS